MCTFLEILTDKVKILLDTREFFSSFVDVPVDPGRKSGKFGQQVDGILVSVVPVFGLLDTLLVCSGESTVVVESSDTHTELGHRMQGLREAAGILASFKSEMDKLW